MLAVQDLLSIASGVLVGFSLGLVGGGGSILSVPLLSMWVGVGSPHLAIGTGAVAVSASAAMSLCGRAARCPPKRQGFYVGRRAPLPGRPMRVTRASDYARGARYRLRRKTTPLPGIAEGDADPARLRMALHS